MEDCRLLTIKTISKYTNVFSQWHNVYVPSVPKIMLNFVKFINKKFELIECFDMEPAERYSNQAGTW
jgi:hypothetical protein